MCGPVALFAVMAASTIASAYASQQQAKRTEQAAVDNYNAQMQQEAQKQLQINQGAAQQESERARAAMIEQGRLRVAAGEAGIGGLTPDAQLRESMFNAGTDITSIENNRKNGILQTGAEAGALRAKAQGIVNTSTRPSAIGTALTIAGQYAGVSSQYPGSLPGSSSGSVSTTGTGGAIRQTNYSQMG